MKASAKLRVLLIDDEPRGLMRDVEFAGREYRVPKLGPSAREGRQIERIAELFEFRWLSTAQEAREFRDLSKVLSLLDPVALGDEGWVPEMLCFEYALTNVRDLAGQGLPTFGICLGHQLIGLAFGGSTAKMPYGHRGGNHPVRDLRSNQVLITTQNHGFAVVGDADGVPGAPGLEVTHLNLNDGTIEGVRHRELPLFAVQYHPEAAPGPHDAFPHFAEFMASLAEEGVGFVNIDQPLYHDSIGPSAHVTSHVAYVRVHGRNYKDWFRKNAGRDARYDYLYTEGELEPLARRIAELARTDGGDDAEGEPPDVYVVTNNHFRGQAAANAKMLESMVDGRKVEAPGELVARYDVLRKFAVPANEPMPPGELFPR